jgi:hypothetical protein
MKRRLARLWCALRGHDFSGPEDSSVRYRAHSCRRCGTYTIEPKS